MATRQQLFVAIRNAHDAGDARAVRALGAELQNQERQAAKPTSFWQGVEEGALKPWNNAAAYLEKGADAIGLGPLMRSASSALSLAPTVAAATNTQHRMFAASPYRGSTAGNITGNVAGTLPLAALPGGVMTQGAAGGALLSDSHTASGVGWDATMGALTSKAGALAIKYGAAPISRAIMSTAPAQAVSGAIGNAATATGNFFGHDVAPYFRQGVGAIDHAVAGAFSKGGGFDQATTNLTDAARLKLPFALADADPRITAIAGSAARKSPDALALAKQTFQPRQYGQADRAVSAIDQHLAPITDIDGRAQSIMDGGKPVYDPLYSKAYQGPTVSSPKIDALLQTPAGGQAVGRANITAANEMRNPQALGFAVDADGKVMLHSPDVAASDRMDAARNGWDAATGTYNDALGRQRASLTPGQFSDQVNTSKAALDAANQELDAAKTHFASVPRSGTVQETPGYTTQSLDYTKGAYDDMLEPYRNPITNRLQLDRNGRAINAQKNTLLSEIDANNPDYAAARQSYGQYAQQSQALRDGHGVLPSGALPMRSFDRIVGRAQGYDAALPPESAGLAQVPELQRGYATSMADTANRMRLSGDPYKAIYGSTDQQAKIGLLFPQGSQDFGRIAQLEGNMGDTYHETLGGSQTAGRLAADSRFSGGLGDIALGATSLAHGNLPGAGIKAITAASKFADKSLSEDTARRIAPMLYDTDPQAGLAYLDELQKRQTMRGLGSRLLSLPMAASAAGFANSDGS